MRRGISNYISRSLGGSVIDLFFENYGHHPKVYAGVLGDESAELLRSFFKGLR